MDERGGSGASGDAGDEVAGVEVGAGGSGVVGREILLVEDDGADLEADGGEERGAEGGPELVLLFEVEGLEFDGHLGPGGVHARGVAG